MHVQAMKKCAGPAVGLKMMKMMMKKSVRSAGNHEAEVAAHDAGFANNQSVGLPFM
jgi:hypothetical protein